MSYVLTLTPGTPFKETPHLSDAFTPSINSSGTVKRRHPRETSTNSLLSLGSQLSIAVSRSEETDWRSRPTPPSRPRAAGHTANASGGERSFSVSTSLRTSPRSSFFSALSVHEAEDTTRDPSPSPGMGSISSALAQGRSNDSHQDSGLASSERLKRVDSTMSTADVVDAPLRNIEPMNEVEDTVDERDFEQDSLASLEPTAFRRWMSTLRRRRQKTRPPAVTPRKQRWILDDFDDCKGPSPRSQHYRHRKSSSQSSSLGFVSAVKSVTVTIASTSIAPLSKRTTHYRRGQQRSSVLSGSETRPSVDSERSVLDEAAKQRSRKRYEKVEELIRTEENYIADVKALSNAYFTLLGQYLPSAGFTRAAAQRNIAEILHLHDELLSDLHKVVPFAEMDKTLSSVPVATTSRQHTRWHSVDVVPTRKSTVRSAVASIRKGRRSLNIGRSSDEEALVPRCSPQVVAAVANAFTSRLKRLKTYEEFGSHFEMMQKDIEETQQIITRWPDYDKAIEALSITIGAAKDRAANHKKALTVKDLLIKPIQRIMRYELLFRDLCKLTPSCDDPDAHGQLLDLTAELHNTCKGVNHAKDNPRYSRALEASWLIGERLNFSDQVPRSVFLTLLGQVVLCGCLHTAYRSRDRIRGSYVTCILFETTLLLASVSDDGTRYSVLVGISLANATIEECDNGKALQCHTAQHSWKVIFEHDARMFEMILTACSAKEAEVWRKRLSLNIALRAKAVAEGSGNPLELHSPMLSEMRSIGNAFGKVGSFVRRMSVQRTATVGPLTDLNQIIIKNTLAVKESPDGVPMSSADPSTSSLPIPRSQSVATPSHVQTLAPRRADRIRLETLLADVWTKDQLPHPGMIPRRSDHPLRAGANHVIRKFSMASITSNFSSSKRTPSFASVASSARTKEDRPPSSNNSRVGYKRAAKSNPGGRPAPLVDFHNAPEAFLPADFELGGGNVAKEAKRKKSALRTLTLTMERPFSPLLGSEAKNGGLRRAQSVKDVRESEQGGSEGTLRPTGRRGEGEGSLAALAVGLGGVDGGGAEVKVKAPRRDGVGEEVRGTGQDEKVCRTPRKMKSRHKLMRLFGQ